MSSSSSFTSGLHPGVVVEGRYRIVRELGRGGMGAVYEAEQIKLRKRVALKVMQPGRARRDQASSLERFLREARAASAIQHRNVVAILDFGDLEDGSTYYVMELLQGRDLSSLLEAEGRLEWPRVRRVLRQILCALGAAHERGIVHRDIKPANVMLLAEPDEWGHEWIKVLDFGIAKLREADDQSRPLTGTSELLGTAAYMAPEVVRGKSPDGRADLYAAGIVAYQLVTGTVPFQGANPFQVLLRHLDHPPPPPLSLVPGLPPAVDAFILRALAKDPDERYPSAVAMIEALDAMAGPPTEQLLQATVPIESLAASGRTEAVPQSPVLPEPLHPVRAASSRRRRAAMLLALAGSVGAAAVVGWWATSAVDTTPEDVDVPAAAGTATPAAERSVPAPVPAPPPPDPPMPLAEPVPAPPDVDDAAAGTDERPVPPEAPVAVDAGTPEPVPQKGSRGKGKCQTYDCLQRRAEQRLHAAVRRRCHALASGEVISVRLTIGTDGRVLMPRAMPPHERTALGKCVVEAVAEATFPPPPKLISKELRFEP